MSFRSLYIYINIIYKCTRRSYDFFGAHREMPQIATDFFDNQISFWFLVVFIRPICSSEPSFALTFFETIQNKIAFFICSPYRCRMNYAFWHSTCSQDANGLEKMTCFSVYFGCGYCVDLVLNNWISADPDQEVFIFAYSITMTFLFFSIAYVQCHRIAYVIIKWNTSFFSNEINYEQYKNFNMKNSCYKQNFYSIIFSHFSLIHTQINKIYNWMQ